MRIRAASAVHARSEAVPVALARLPLGAQCCIIKKRPRREAGAKDVLDRGRELNASRDRRPCMTRIPPPVRRYIGQFQIKAVCRLASGYIAARVDPRDALVAWWCDAALAAHVAREARKRDGDIVGAAGKLGVPLTAHDVVLSRASAAIARLDDLVDQAHADGKLPFFNREYRRRREAAQARGAGFISYGQARARLGKVLASVPAGTASRAVLLEVFS
jgi:hypothetical protein